jgi:hypothetical protein
MRTLRAMIERASVGAERMFLAEGSLAPIWLAWKADGKSFLVPQLVDDWDQSLGLIRALFEIEQIVSYVSVAEAWMTAGHEIEIISFVAEDQQLGLLRAWRAIRRDAAGKPSLGPLEFAEGAWQTEGRMVGLLPARGTRQ